MNKIYGYKEKDVIGLAEFIKARKKESLSDIFSLYAKSSGKAKGTVRNLYYALAKTTKTDEVFCKKYFDRKPLSVGKIEGFSQDEEKQLVKKILLGKKEGQSVRSIIMELSEGDAKLALRYQNKFRNALKNKPRLIAEIVKELKDEGQEIGLYSRLNNPADYISEKQLLALKREINNLVEKISLKAKKENEILRERVSVLERENLRLSTLLYGDGKKVGAARYFKVKGREELLN